jgi:hypothetical protein
MKIVGLMVCGPNEKYLDTTLKEFKRLCDDVIVATNNIDEDSLKLIESYRFNHYEDNREWGNFQPNIKTDLLNKAGELRPDWIIALDADEVFAPEFTREEAERLASLNEIAYYFLIVNLYNDKEHFAHSSGIQRFWNIRFYKYLPEFGLQFQRKKLHCGLAPPIAYKYGWHAPYYVEHYGLMDKEDRIRKHVRYQKYDPQRKFKSGQYYDELIEDLREIPFDRIGLLNKLKESPETQFRNKPPIPKNE